MSQIITVVCDSCGKDITYASPEGYNEYSITLGVRHASVHPYSISHNGNYIIDDIVSVPPNTPGTDFCDIKCLTDALAQSTKS